jgi:hypothetical protein
VSAKPAISISQVSLAGSLPSVIWSNWQQRPTLGVRSDGCQKGQFAQVRAIEFRESVDSIRKTLIRGFTEAIASAVQACDRFCFAVLSGVPFLSGCLMNLR